MLQPSSFRSPFWPQLTAHRRYWERYNCAQVYEYDPTDDGPEVYLAFNIRATHAASALAFEQDTMDTIRIIPAEKRRIYFGGILRETDTN